MLNFGASKPRVKGGPGPRGPPGSTPEQSRSFSLKLPIIHRVGINSGNSKKSIEYVVSLDQVDIQLSWSALRGILANSL